MSKPGDLITYSFLVTNTGTVPLSGVSVADTQVAPAGALASGPTCQSLAGPTAPCTGNTVTLAVGQSATFGATYVVTAADLANGSVNDSATATGTPPSGPAVTTAPSTVSVPVTGLTIVKSSTTGSISAVGDVITYSFVVTNTGTVTMSDVSVTDTQLAPAGVLASGPTCTILAAPAGVCTGGSTVLLAGQSATFTATYVATAADIGHGRVDDSATATGTPPSGPSVTTPPATLSVPVAGLTIVKSSTAGSVSTVGRDRHVFVPGHQHRIRPAERCVGHRHPDRAGRRVDLAAQLCDPGQSGGHVLGRDHCSGLSVRPRRSLRPIR